MSKTEDRHEAERWLATAADDLQVARVVAAGGHHAHACFHAQQAAEKAVKALWRLAGREPWGHSVQKLLMDLPQAGGPQCPAPLLQAAAALDRLYIPTRYPNGLPDLTPAQSFFEADSIAAFAKAGQILDYVSAILNR